MKAFEFQTKVTSDGKLDLPDALAGELQSQPVVRVIVLVNEPPDIYEDQDWSRLSAEQFLSGYDDTDAIYDRLN